jgi:hypothetical protein
VAPTQPRDGHNAPVRGDDLRGGWQACTYPGTRSSARRSRCATSSRNRSSWIPPTSREPSATRPHRSGKPSSVPYGGTVRSAQPEREVGLSACCSRRRVAQAQGRKTMRATPGGRSLTILLPYSPKCGEKLFGKYLKVSRACFFGGKTRPIEPPSTPFGSFRSPNSGPSPIFQTVSPRRS